MKSILILGGSGRTGRLIVQESVKKGYRVSVLVRDLVKVSDIKGIKVYEGSPYDKVSLENALADSQCQYIINALNISRINDIPWARLRSPKDLISQTISNLIALSPKYRIQQIISVSAWGVNETKQDIPFWFRWLIYYSNIKFGYVEHENQERLLRESNLNWTIVRPVGLTNSRKTKETVISFKNNPKPSILISRGDVASFVVKMIGNPDFYLKTPTISSK